MIQRRRRPKRRSTGVVHVDMEVSWGFWEFSLSLNFNFTQDIDSENRQESPVDNGEDKELVSDRLKALKIRATRKLLSLIEADAINRINLNQFFYETGKVCESSKQLKMVKKVKFSRIWDEKRTVLVFKSIFGVNKMQMLSQWNN